MTTLDDLGPQCRNIILRLEEMRLRKSSRYPEAIACLVDRLPMDCEERQKMKRHLADYDQSLILEKKQAEKRNKVASVMHGLKQANRNRA